jgi:methionyl-tRNA formyltransferase
MTYLICCSKKWFVKNSSKKFKKKFKFIFYKKKLNYLAIKKINPKIIFFCHWSYIVPKNIFNNFLCINFHTAPLPFGRGGSPIQNLIKRGIKKTPVCAIKMVDEIDAGPIYLKKNIQLTGSLNTILSSISLKIEVMILELIRKLPKPIKQKGTIKIFKRLEPKMSEIKKNDKFSKIYDKVRMLDSTEYPRAFIKFNNFIIKFSNIKKKGLNSLSASCHIKKK